MRLEDLPCSLSNIEAICVDTYTPLCIIDVPGLISRRFTLCKKCLFLIVAAHYTMGSRDAVPYYRRVNM